MATALRTACLLATVLAALGCAPGSADDIPELEDTQREQTAVPLLDGDEVPPAIAQAAILHQLIATVDGFDLEAVDAVRTHPVESLGGDVVGYLAIVAPAGSSRGDALDLALESAADGDLRAYMMGARVDRAPLSMADASGELARRVARTVDALGGRAAVARLVAVTSTELLIETRDGALLMAGATAPLSEFELEQLDAIEAERARIADELDVEVRQHLAEQWMPLVHRAADRSYDDFVDADGNLDLEVARRTLTADRILDRPEILREPPATDDALDGPAKQGQAIKNGATACASYFLWQCTEWRYDEVGAYAPSCIGAQNPYACDGNLSVAAVPHKEMAHPIDGYTYAGCGPESFASLVWQRWHRGDRFGFGTNELADVPTYRSPSGSNTIMHQAAHGANRAMGSFPVKDGNIATWPWEYADGANAWLAERGSSDRIAGHWSLLDGNAWQSSIDKSAEALHELVGRGFGPAIALGGVGDTFGSPHYAPVYRYRITRTSSGKARAVFATIDWNVEFALSDPWQYATGVFYFQSDLAAARSSH